MITIRQAVAGDEAAVFILARDFATSFPVERLGFAESFVQVLASQGMYLAVATNAETIIGYVLGTTHPCFYASGRVAWVEEIMVAEAFRRSGVGRELMGDFERWAQVRKARVVALATRRAAEFYKSIGYAESATYFRRVI